MPFTPLSSLLGNKRHKQVLTAALMVNFAQRVLGGRAQVISVKNGVIKLKVESSVQASEIKMSESGLIEEINLKVGKDTIKKVSYKVGN